MKWLLIKGDRPKPGETPFRDEGDASQDAQASRAQRLAGLRLVLISALGVTSAGWIVQGRSDAFVEVVTIEPATGSAVTLPVAMNERVERWMVRFLTDQRAEFERHLARSGMYSGLIQAKLRERGMPEELLYLAMIESGFLVSATSPVAAAGVWQFMGPTARQYGLRIDGWVDERRDPVSATDAALDYLEWLHGRYGSWYLAAAAYNAGPGRVDSVLRRHADGRRGEEAIYWDIVDHLPRETREYVPKMIAVTLLARDAEAYGFHVVPDSPYMYDRVWVPGGTLLAEVAAALAVGVDHIGDLNPHLIRGATPPGPSYGLRVPVGTTGQVVASIGGRGWAID